MKTISVVNHKGGVGKTVTVLNLGAELADRGYKVLLVDFDSQANLTLASGVSGDADADDLEETIASELDAIIDDPEHEIRPPIYRTMHEGCLDIMPSNINLANVGLKLNFVIFRERQLDKILDAVRKRNIYDYCIIDNAPSIGVDFQNALYACDEILIVVNPDIFSTKGLSGLLSNYRKVKGQINSELKIAGVLINNCDRRTNYAREMMALIKEVWSDLFVFRTVIPKSVRVKESTAMRQSVRGYDRGNPAGIAFSAFADEYLDREAEYAKV